MVKEKIAFVSMPPHSTTAIARRDKIFNVEPLSP